MKFFSKCKLILYIVLCFSFVSLEGAIVQINGKWSDTRYAPTLPISEHFDLGCKYFAEEDWGEALKNFLIISLHFPNSPFYSDALFNSAVCYYQLSDYDLANKQFSKYLNLGGSLKNFEKVFEYKLEIAEAYAKGSKKRLFGVKQMPRIMPAKGDAITLYDEVVASLPGREIAAKALFGKAQLLRKRREYRESIESLQLLARRFPKHTLAADAYLMISEVYLEQSAIEAQNPDLLALAQINLNRFQKQFPGDERFAIGEKNLLNMKETFAKSLYDTGRFYEKKKKTHASRIYFNEAIKRYPETQAASRSQERLSILERKSQKQKVTDVVAK